VSAGNLARAACGSAAHEDSNMTDIGPSIPSGYISDAELIGWLQQKSEDQYTDLRGVMNASTERGELMKDLSALKADIDADATPDEVINRLQTLRDKYADTPYAAELEALLGGMQDKIEANTRCETEIQRDLDEVTGLLSDPDHEYSDVERQALEDKRDDLIKQLSTPQATPFKDEFSAKVQTEVDQLGRIDQLELIKIQELMSDARQTSQLGSNIMASRDQASNAIVGNIRG
jgi:hypothetical protein